MLYAVLNNVFSLGYFPEILLPVFPLIKSILQSPILKIWASPEKVFFLSYVVIEFMVVRSTFKFSKLVKYNILMLFALLMIQGLVISYWDLLFHRQIATPVAKWAYDQGSIIYTDKNLAIVFFLNTFIIFLVSGFWHGASWNFIIWGLYFGILLLFEKLIINKILEKSPLFLRHLYSLFFIIIGWSIFYFIDIKQFHFFSPFLMLLLVFIVIKNKLNTNSNMSTKILHFYSFF